MINDDDIKRKYDEVNKKLSNPKISKKVDEYLKKIAILVNCNVEINFSVLPHMDDYAEFQDSEDFKIPDFKTLKLRDFVNHLNKEKDGDFDVYFDPIYLKKGVNELIDVLITTSGNKVIIVPISNNKNVEIK